MKRTPLILALLSAALLAGSAWAQTDTSSQTPDSGSQQQPSGAPPAAFGQNNDQPPAADNPPISGLDQPSLEPHGAARSFLLPGAHLSEAADSNIGSSTGTSNISSVTRLLGSLTLQRLWSHYDTAIDYIGGGAFYSRNINGSHASQVHTLDIDQRILWRTGQLAIRDAFSYLPEGSFGYGSFGGAGALTGIGGFGGGLTGGGLGGNGFFGPGQFATLGQAPRFTNTAVVDIAEALSPRSSVTLAGSYGLVHFTDSSLGFINSKQVTAQAGYNYQLNRTDQIGIVYGYQAFRYPSTVASDFNTNLVHVLYGHRISGRMDLILGGGPQFTQINNPTFGSTNRLTASGRASLRYRFPTTSVSLTYDRYNSSGSGLFAGATSDVVRITASRPLWRVWTVTGDIGYTHNSRLTPSTAGINALNYNYLYAGFSARRQLGRDFGVFVSYQFNDLAFDQSFCGPSTACNRTSQRHVATFGVDWHPHPIRLD